MVSATIFITDIGSTNTKGILLKRDRDEYKIIAIAKDATTVEDPQSDVKIGVFRVAKKLEAISSVAILDSSAAENNLVLAEGVEYLTTSSAGGGLQILVIGLSRNDSAGSAERAAFGAGGVILETLAIDDGRSSIEQIQLINLLRPDIILFSGGINGGAYASVIRMAEVLNVANPKPKFGVSSKIPLIYAGNVDAQMFMKSVFSAKYDLHLTENIRPTMKEENLEPAREEIHRLFMENVMEQAPGYSELKKQLKETIIPTPSGVIKSLEMVSRKFDKQIISVDIGGATTDIFSNVFGNYYRTVSANFGMSYSIANVMADTGIERVMRWLPSDFDSDYVRNYICNKMLYPTYIAQNEREVMIEHSLAREAIALAREHHLQMNFQKERVGRLDMLKDRDACLFKEAMYYEKTLAKKRFFLRNFDIVIGAGGVISNVSNKHQISLLLVDAFSIDGITEIWRDREFISPHLGKLSDLDSNVAEQLLLENGYEKLVTSIRPIFKLKRKPKCLLTIKIRTRELEESYEIYPDKIELIDCPVGSEVEIVVHKGCTLGSANESVTLTSDVPLLIDTRKSERYNIGLANDVLKLYNLEVLDQSADHNFSQFMNRKIIADGIAEIERRLPYNGDLSVSEGETVEPERLLAEAKFDPPRLYILNIASILNIDLSSFREGLLVSPGEEIDLDQKLFAINSKGLLTSNVSYSSSVRGMIEDINYDTGSIYVREIQDYPLKAVKLKVAEAIGIKPKQLKGYLKKKKNDFVRTGELLAKNLIRGDMRELENSNASFMSPTTGTITDVNEEDGSITIQYLKKPYRLYAGVTGKVSKVRENRSLTIEYNGTTIDGIIGFGGECYSTLEFLDEIPDKNWGSYRDKIVALPHSIDFQLLQEAEKAGIKGLIIPSINNSDLVRYLGKEIGVALTGKEPIPCSIIITEGFDSLPMHPSLRKVLSGSAGKRVFLDTFTQIRAGVKRPKIILT